ncbi:hypothetical protein KIPB_002294 [Kipferlia bialata]|uniref:Uncharacterized protein n=1 Tax=Kipferlia bialata TaxID=797122 RepID=A0A9K3CR83_9EUKA|nr:hypothetical protein KIPB_002294 [Kipferlia bialata]|eukprot:g2294.t1
MRQRRRHLAHAFDTEALGTVSEWGRHVDTDGYWIGVSYLYTIDGEVQERTTVFERRTATARYWNWAFTCPGGTVGVYSDVLAVTYREEGTESIHIYNLEEVEVEDTDDDDDPVYEWTYKETVSQGSPYSETDLSHYGDYLYLFYYTLIVGGGDGVYIYQMGQENGAWELVWDVAVSGQREGERQADSIALYQGTLLMQVADSRVAVFSSDWSGCYPEGLSVSASDGNGGVEVSLSPALLDVYVPNATPIGVTYQPEIDSPSLSLSLSQESSDVVYTRDSEWLVPGDYIQIHLGLHYVSELLEVGANCVNCVNCVNTVDVLAVVTNSVPMLDMEGQSISSVELGGTYAEGSPASLSIGSDSVSVPATVECVSSVCSAVLDVPLVIPADWQPGAEGQLLPVPLAISVDDPPTDTTLVSKDTENTTVTVTESGTGWILGTASSGAPVRGEVLDMDRTPIPRGLSSSLTLALYDDTGAYVSCGTERVSLVQPENEDIEQYFVYPMGADSDHCTLHYVVPDSAPPNYRMDVQYEGSTITSIPIAVVSSSLSWLTLPFVCVPCVLLVIVLAGLRFYTMRRTDVPTTVTRYKRPSSKDRLAFYERYSYSIGVLLILAVLRFVVDYYVALRFLGSFVSTQVSVPLSTMPVVKYLMYLVTLLDRVTSSLVQWVLDSVVASGSSLRWIEATLGGVIVLVLCGWVLYGIGAAQAKTRTVGVRLCWYTLFPLVRAVTLYVGCVLSDAVWWALSTDTVTSTDAPILLYSVCAILGFTLMAYFGQMGSISRHTKDSFAVVYNWLNRPGTMGSVVLRWCVAVLLTPSYLCYTILSPATHALMYSLMASVGVQGTLSTGVTAVAHSILCLVVGAAYTLCMYSAAPVAAGVGCFAVLSCLSLSLLLERRNSERGGSTALPEGDGENGGESATVALGRLVPAVYKADLDRKGRERDLGVEERYGELASSLRCTGLVLLPLVGPALSSIGDTLSSPPLLVKYGVRHYPINWVTNALSLVVLYTLVASTRTSLQVQALVVYTVLKLFDVAQHGRVLAKRQRWFGYVPERSTAPSVGTAGTDDADAGTPVCASPVKASAPLLLSSGVVWTGVVPTDAVVGVVGEGCSGLGPVTCVLEVPKMQGTTIVDGLPLDGTDGVDGEASTPSASHAEAARDVEDVEDVEEDLEELEVSSSVSEVV